MFYLSVFLASLILASILTPLVRRFAWRFKIVDRPDQDRKIHGRSIPLLGGLAIFIAYFVILFIFPNRFLSGPLAWPQLIGFFIGALILVSGGFLDDKYNLSPAKQIIFPLLAVVAVIAGGVEITKITNPFGGVVDLQTFFLIGPLLIAGWLFGLMYTTKLLDGVDGLVTGVTAIGGLIIFLFTLTTKYYQPNLAFAAIILTGACLGFLIFNFNPAKIFLGEGGSLLLGYILGVLAIISGGKIAITLLVMGIPILDVVWTILRRLVKGRNPFRVADRQHLHHRFLDLGFSQRQTVMIFYALSLIFGLSGLFLQSRGKFWALAILLIAMFGLIIFFNSFERRDGKKNGRSGGGKNAKPSLLLQVCCAPCGAFISRDRLAPRFNLTWYFYNPNLSSREEYDKRLAAVRCVAEKYGWPLIVEPYRPDDWQNAVLGREGDPEKGLRCRICYRFRLLNTFKLAQRRKFDYFGTTLLVSPYKDTAAIRQIGREIAAGSRVRFLDEDFQADGGYAKSQALAKELGIYRQKFCGCEYSLKSKV